MSELFQDIGFDLLPKFPPPTANPVILPEIFPPISSTPPVQPPVYEKLNTGGGNNDISMGTIIIAGIGIAVVLYVGYKVKQWAERKVQTQVKPIITDGMQIVKVNNVVDMQQPPYEQSANHLVEKH